jgi:hypothetical protein
MTFKQDMLFKHHEIELIKKALSKAIFFNQHLLEKEELKEQFLRAFLSGENRDMLDLQNKIEGMLK